MDEQEYGKFNWTMLFIVTACSSFLFSLAIKIIDGIFPEFLLVTGGIASLLSVLSVVINVIMNQPDRKSKQSRYKTDANID